MISGVTVSCYHKPDMGIQVETLFPKRTFEPSSIMLKKLFTLAINIKNLENSYIIIHLCIPSPHYTDLKTNLEKEIIN